MVKVNGIKKPCTDSTQSKLNIRMPCVTSLKVSAKIPHDFDRMRHMPTHVYVSTFHKEYLTLLPGHFLNYYLHFIMIPFNSFIVKLKDKCRTCSPYPNIYSIDVLHLGIVSQRYDMNVTSDYLEIALWHLVWRSVIARRCFNNYPDSPQEDAYPTTVSKNYNCLWFNSSV